MQWLEQLPFADNRVVQMGFLAACGIAALVVLAILYRLVFAHRLRVPGGRTRQPRLGLVDAFSLDGQRQLVLVRRDNVEHLVMIGGPNDVLVESQINRAMTPARENNQASPLLAPGAASRRTETPLAAAPVVAEAPPAKVATPAPTAPKAPAAAPASAPPKAPAAAAVPQAPNAPAPASAPPAPKATASAPLPAAQKPPAPVTVNASATVSAPTNVSALAPAAKPVEAARPAPVPPQTPQTPELDRAAPASSRPSRSPMPPPIVPAAGAANRATVTRLTEKVPPRPSPVSGNPPVAPLPEKTEATAAPIEPRPAPPTPIVVAPSPASALALQAGKTQPPEGGQKIGEARPPADKPNPSTAKPAKIDDPFADLDSLEAEMARLLGREKMG